VRDEHDRVLLVTGAAGGPRIISATFGIVSAVLDFGVDVATAVAAPRSHHQHLPDELMVEADSSRAAGSADATPDASRGPRFPEDTLSALSALGHTLKRVASMADASTIGRDPADPSRWLGVAEPRAHGAAAGVR
jgi:gamma-glutamyltranspeptidase / glutathione hydrolase